MILLEYAVRVSVADVSEWRADFTDRVGSAPGSRFFQDHEIAFARRVESLVFATITGLGLPGAKYLQRAAARAVL
jgi:hypothetical protein